VTSTAIINEIKDLAPEQAKVIQFAVDLPQSRKLAPEELGELADRLAATEDPSERIRLRSALTRGFYGE
jgi:hypothetical protein